MNIWDVHKKVCMYIHMYGQKKQLIEWSFSTKKIQMSSVWFSGSHFGFFSLYDRIRDNYEYLSPLNCVRELLGLGIHFDLSPSIWCQLKSLALCVVLWFITVVIVHTSGCQQHLKYKKSQQVLKLEKLTFFMGAIGKFVDVKVVLDFQ